MGKGKKDKVKPATLEDLQTMFASDDRMKAMTKRFGDIDGLLASLGSHAKDGLPKKQVTQEALEQRRLEFGSNELPEPPPKSLFSFAFEALQDPIIILLIVCAIVSLTLGLIPQTQRAGEESTGWVDGAAILVAVAVVTCVDAGQNYSKELKFRKLNKVKNDREVKVWRNGALEVVSIHTVVVGDVVELQTGDYVPADGVFISGDNLACDESSMTGEPMAIKKTEKKPFLLSGCNVNEGQGTYLVTNVGLNSEWGQLYKSLSNQEASQTPLEEKLEELAQLIGYFGFGVAIVLFIVLSIIWLANFANGVKTGKDALDFLDFLIQGIVIIVVAVPEGLPLAVTISLAYSMQSMLKDQNLVRQLAACETMGGATQICSDKTGTLTQNRMTVVSAWAAGEFHKPAKSFEKNFAKKVPKKTVQLFAQGVSVNSNAFFKRKNPEDEPEFNGNKTECALLLMADRLGFDYDQIRKTTNKSHMIPFSSDRKRMSTIIESKGKYMLHCKGASEIVLALCDTYVDADGAVTALSSKLRKEIEKYIEDLAGDGLRTLVIAYRNLDDADASSAANAGEDEEKNMTLIALVGIQDPLRPEVPDAIADCRRAGITVRMVTGDNILTARKIATDCGIFVKKRKDIAMEGPEFREMSDEKLGEIIDRLTVLARSKPNDKFRLVKFLRARREVVAATGDGTNDAPALKAADVGMAMGIAGTEIAKEASDIIIMDDNFASIVKAVLWGRNVRASIQKFLQFQITINIVALVVAFVGGVSGYGEPLKPIQLLWVNLQMDSFAALALATDKPEDTLLNQKPAGRHLRLIDGAMWRNIVIGSLYEIIWIFIIMYGGPSIFGDLVKEEADPACVEGLSSSGPVECGPRIPKSTHAPTVLYTFLFNTFVWMQFFNEICARRIREIDIWTGLHKNAIFIGVLFITAALQILFVSVGGTAMGVVPQTVELWFISIGIGASMLIVGIISRLLPIYEPDWMIYSKGGVDDEEAGDEDDDVSMEPAGKDSSASSSEEPAEDDSDSASASASEQSSSEESS